ncbi:MAG: hypothetical protein HW380_2500 [Magnetococcales bacterium]|nr:hypothetical protein [Magnetococcales bacterium]
MVFTRKPFLLRKWTLCNRARKSEIGHTVSDGVYPQNLVRESVSETDRAKSFPVHADDGIKRWEQG